MKSLRRLRCYLIAFWENVTLSSFWSSGGTTTVAAHDWPWPPRWTEDRASEHGLVQYEILDCSMCGTYREGPGWRRFYGTAS